MWRQVIIKGYEGNTVKGDCSALTAMFLLQRLYSLGWYAKSGSECAPVEGLVNTVINLRVPYNIGKFLSS
jgi:hypothetical protein